MKPNELSPGVNNTPKKAQSVEHHCVQVQHSPGAELTRTLRWLFYLLLLIGPLAQGQTESTTPVTNGVPEPNLSYVSQPRSIWETGVGEGFHAGTQSASISSGVNFGLPIFGSQQAHNLALISFTYGHMVGHFLGEGHWYRGNPEIRLELFTGAEFSPSTEWFVGLSPHFRYSFATGTRWIPFVDVGAGVTATSIGPPDLSGTFEFNLQPGLGTLWFLKDKLALSLEARYLHMSCAGIHKPNLGLNGVAGLLGITFFF